MADRMHSGETCGFEMLANENTRPVEWRFSRFRVAFRDLHAENPGLCGIEPALETCRMMICLDGDLSLCVSGTGQDENMIVSAGCCSLHYHPDMCRCLACKQDSLARVLELICPADEFLTLAGGGRLGMELAEAVKTGRPFHIHQTMNPALHDALISLRNSLSENGGDVNAPIILSKVLEVVWLFVKSREPGQSEPLTSATRSALEKARVLLEVHMADPPALDDLAAEVGMSVSKLKQTFPLVFGLPPYAYLRKIRMEKAKGLLVHRKLSVTEAAYEVGYTNLSHFARAFTEHHGVKPSQIQ